MNIKFFSFFIFIVIMFFGCSKKNNIKLAQVYYKLALLELSEKENNEVVYKQSLNYIEKAIEQSINPEYFALKATLLFKLGKSEEGNFYFDKALEQQLDPRVKTEILNNKACLLADLGCKNGNEDNINEALKIWQELENDKSYLTPEVAFFNQSRVYLHKRDLNKAQEMLIKATNISPGYLDAHYYLGVVAYYLKNLSLAKNEIKTVLFLEPNHDGAKYFSDLIDR